MTAFTERAFIKVLSRIFSRNHPNFKDQIIPAGSNPGYGPPFEQSPDPDPIEFRYLSVFNLPRYPLRVSSQVVVRRERDLARATEINGEVTGCLVKSVLRHRGRKKTDRKTIVYKLGVCLGERRFGIGVFRVWGLRGKG